MDPLQHYMTYGWREGRDPHPLFSTSFYLQQNADVAAAGENPLVHYCLVGWKEGRDPHPSFDTSWYLDQHPNVVANAINPLAHYIAFGRQEYRDVDFNRTQPLLPKLDVSEGSVDLTLTECHSKFTEKGAEFERFDSGILNGAIPNVKLLAFYLPQFHATPENDKFWGEGFTEWRQIPRGIPRFPGHYQPRIPRDFGYYDLNDITVLARQAEVAKAAGIYGFGFYYYWFNGKRVLHKPVEKFLQADWISMPFFIIWANENWTRTWDGMNTDVLLQQDYLIEHEEALLADLARHFNDRRYIAINGRPLFVIYKPIDVPDAKVTFERWRAHLRSRHGIEPLIFMAQTFGHVDPTPLGLDGALEFPPHKLTQTLHGRAMPDAFHPEFNGRVISYDEFVDASLLEGATNYPLIKTAVPSWDNEPRRPMRGLMLEGCSPKKYEAWLRQLAERTSENSILGERFVAINAWNEWAEGAYLEPDVYYGAAYLNSTARAIRDISGVKSKTPSISVIEQSAKQRNRISVIVPNYNHVRFLTKRLKSIISQSRVPDEIIFLDDASEDNSVEVAQRILAQSTISHSVVVNDNNSGNVFKQWTKGLSLATGNLIWIAESDDDADSEFLARIEQAFEREDVLLAYGHIRYVNSDGSPNSDLDSYYNELTGDWSRSHLTTSFQTFGDSFAIKNVVPNVSGAVFRKPYLSPSEIERLTAYRYAGDWYFYALVARGGSIAYCHEAKSFFRKHSGSVSGQMVFSERHILERRMILEDLRSLYEISSSVASAHLHELSLVVGREIVADSIGQEVQVKEGRSSPYRLCIAADSFGIGGGELLPIELANALRAIGHHITYMVLERDQSQGQSLRRRLRNDIPVVYFQDVRENFTGFLNDFGIEVINSHNVSIEYNLFCRGIEIELPYLASLHGGYETVPDLLSDHFIRYVGKSVDAWLYLSQKNIEPLISRGLCDARFVQVHNAVSLRSVSGASNSKLREKLGIAESAFVLVLASRAIREKGWQTAIDVTAQLRRTTGRDCQLLLLGDGVDFVELKARNANRSYVRFLGHVEEPLEWIQICDAGIFPSIFAGETCPLFILECFQCGVPVVASDIGEIGPLIQGHAGTAAGATVSWTLPAMEMKEALHDKLSAIVNDCALLAKWRSNALARSRDFDVKVLARIYLKCIEEVCTSQLLNEMYDEKTMWPVPGFVDTRLS